MVEVSAFIRNNAEKHNNFLIVFCDTRKTKNNPTTTNEIDTLFNSKINSTN